MSALPGLALLGFVIHEGERMVLPDNSVSTPGWTRFDLGAREILYDGRLFLRTITPSPHRALYIGARLADPQGRAGVRAA